MNLLETFRKVILLNEGDPSDPDYWLKFTDPDGVHSGKSGWSFGVVQFDIANNPLAVRCLEECGFKDAGIVGLIRQEIDEKPLEAKLRAHADIIQRYDEHQLEGCLDRARVILDKFGIQPMDDAAVLAVADYDNQYHLSALDKPGYLVHMLSRLSRPYVAHDVLDFKLECTKYGQTKPDDCRRRYLNIMKVMEA